MNEREQVRTWPATECCRFHATGGHPQDRHGFDDAGTVYRARAGQACTDVPAPAIDGVRAELLGLLKHRLCNGIIANRLATGMSLADATAAGSRLFQVAKLGPCPERRGPRCDCGCSASEHEHSGYCANHFCGCTGWRRSQARSEQTTLSITASCADVCTCGGEHREGAAYYVSAVSYRQGKPFVALLLGPYDSHSLALSLRAKGRLLMERVAPYDEMDAAVGTLAFRADVEHKPGKLNDMLDAEDAAAQVTAEPTAKKPRRGVKATLVAESHTPGDKR